MIITDHLRNYFQTAPLVFWAGLTGADGFCQITRATGINPHADGEHVTFYVSEKWGGSFFTNLDSGQMLSLLVASVATFESYQFKGDYLSRHPVTSPEAEIIRLFCQNTINTLERQGLKGSQILSPFSQSLNIGITMRVQEVFNQTPRPGTGNKISN